MLQCLTNTQLKLLANKSVDTVNTVNTALLQDSPEGCCSTTQIQPEELIKTGRSMLPYGKKRVLSHVINHDSYK